MILSFMVKPEMILPDPLLQSGLAPTPHWPTFAKITNTKYKPQQRAPRELSLPGVAVDTQSYNSNDLSPPCPISNPSPRFVSVLDQFFFKIFHLKIE